MQRSAPGAPIESIAPLGPCDLSNCLKHAGWANAGSKEVEKVDECEFAMQKIGGEEGGGDRDRCEVCWVPACNICGRRSPSHSCRKSLRRTVQFVACPHLLAKSKQDVALDLARSARAENHVRLVHGCFALPCRQGGTYKLHTLM